MKKIFVTMSAMLMLAFATDAQILKNNFMSYTEIGQPIEKKDYVTNEDKPLKDVWCGALDSKKVEGSVSPVAGEPLIWEGYNEGGNSICISSSFPEGISGSRYTTYSFGQKYQDGVYYLSFVADFKAVRAGGSGMNVGFARNVLGNGMTAGVRFYRDDENKGVYHVAVVMDKTVTEVPVAYNLNEPHLFVLKLDTAAKSASLYVDPTLKKEPKKAVAVAVSDIADRTPRITGVSVRDHSKVKGNIGSFRVTQSWKSISE